MTQITRTPPIIIHSAPKVKEGLIIEFEQTNRIRLPIGLRGALMTMNYKDLGQTLAFVSECLNNTNQNKKG